MLLDAEFRSRELVVFSFRSSQQLRNRLDFQFEVHRQAVLYKDAEPKVTKKILSFEPHNISEETYLTYTRADDSFRQLGRHVYFIPPKCHFPQRTEHPKFLIFLDFA